MNFRIYTKKKKLKKGKINYHSSNINVIDEANMSPKKSNGSPRTNSRIKIKVCKL
jgi:hypothetical protein